MQEHFYVNLRRYGVKTGVRETNSRSFGSGQQSALRFEELADAGFSVVHHLKHASAGKGLAFGGSLNLDQAAILGQDDVHVDVCLRIFMIGEVEENFIIDDADTR